MDPRTIKALAELTDEGQFERMALSILQHAEPLCAALSQQGVNAAGKTRKSPIDNIGFVRSAAPPHMVVIHHTTCVERDLRGKWMAGADGGDAARLGDIIKTANIVIEERQRTPGLVATLFLTTNREPAEKLVRDATALGATYGLTVDIWSRVRLARVLDLDAVGQSIRRTYLGIAEAILSPALLAELSRGSLATMAPPAVTSAWIGRDLDRQLVQSRRPVSFIIGESGSGKTVACLRTMGHWIAGGGYALILTEDIVELAASLNAAVLEALRRLHPALADTPGALSIQCWCIPSPLKCMRVSRPSNSRLKQSDNEGRLTAVCRLIPESPPRLQLLPLRNSRDNYERRSAFEIFGILRGGLICCKTVSRRNLRASPHRALFRKPVCAGCITEPPAASSACR